MIFSLMAHFLVKLCSCRDVGKEKYRKVFFRGINLMMSLQELTSVSSAREHFKLLHVVSNDTKYYTIDSL